MMRNWRKPVNPLLQGGRFHAVRSVHIDLDDVPDCPKNGGAMVSLSPPLAVNDTSWAPHAQRDTVPPKNYDQKPLEEKETFIAKLGGQADRIFHGHDCPTSVLKWAGSLPAPKHRVPI